MEHLVKLLRDSYDLQEEKDYNTAYWHLQQLRREIKKLTLTDVSYQRELLKRYNNFINRLQPDDNHLNDVDINEFIKL